MQSRKETEIVEEIAVLSVAGNGWRKELNKVSWFGDKPKYDIRTWSEDHQIIGKGITLTEEELVALRDALNDIPAGN